MHEHEISVVIIRDGREAFYAKILAKCHANGVVESHVEYADANGATRDLLYLVSTELVRQAVELTARHPHASTQEKRENAGFAKDDPNGTSPQKPT